MKEIRDEILTALSTSESFLALNFKVPKKLIEQYGTNIFFNVLEEMEKEELIYWQKINAHTTVIKRTEKSLQQV
jgi:hypothetical protein